MPHVFLFVESLKVSLGASTAQLAQLSSSFALSYGVFKLVGSVASDFVAPRTLFGAALLAASLLTLTFALNS